MEGSQDLPWVSPSYTRQGLVVTVNHKLLSVFSGQLYRLCPRPSRGRPSVHSPQVPRGPRRGDPTITETRCGT